MAKKKTKAVKVKEVITDKPVGQEIEAFEDLEFVIPEDVGRVEISDMEMPEITMEAPKAEGSSDEEEAPEGVKVKYPKKILKKEEEQPREITLFEKLTPSQLQQLQGVANRFSFMKIGRGLGKMDEKMFNELSKEVGFLGMLSPDLLALFK